MWEVREIDKFVEASSSLKRDVCVIFTERYRSSAFRFNPFTPKVKDFFPPSSYFRKFDDNMERNYHLQDVNSTDYFIHRTYRGTYKCVRILLYKCDRLRLSTKGNFPLITRTDLTKGEPYVTRKVQIERIVVNIADLNAREISC